MGGERKQTNRRRSSPDDVAFFGACFTLMMPGSFRIHSPEQPRKMMRFVVVCVAFGLTVSEIKAEIMYLRTKGMAECPPPPPYST